MISLSAAILQAARKTKQLLHIIVIHGLHKNPAGYGLYTTTPFTGSKPKPPITLRINKRRPRIPKY